MDDINLENLPKHLRESIESERNKEKASKESEDDGHYDDNDDTADEESLSEDQEDQEAGDDDDGQSLEDEKSSDPAQEGRKRKKELDSKLAETVDANTRFLDEVAKRNEEAAKRNQEALEKLRQTTQELEEARKKQEELLKKPEHEPEDDQEDDQELIETLGEEAYKKLVTKNKIEREKALEPIQKQLKELQDFKSKQDEMLSKTEQKEKQLNAFKESGAWDLMLDDNFQKYLKQRPHDDYSTSYAVVARAIDAADKDEIIKIVKPLHEEYKKTIVKEEIKAKADPKVNQSNKSPAPKKKPSQERRLKIEKEIQRKINLGDEAGVKKLYEELEAYNED